MREELQEKKEYLMANNSQYRQIARETENMSWQEIFELYHIDIEKLRKQTN